MRSVSGSKFTLQQDKAATAKHFARNDYRDSIRCYVSDVTVRGNQAQAILHWHYVVHYVRSAAGPTYTEIRDYQEQTLWKKLPSGWHAVTADETRNIFDYHR